MSVASFRSIIELWPSRDALAAEIGAPASTVSKWFQRDSIPPSWWSRLVELPVAGRAGVDERLLATLAARVSA